MNDFNIGDIVHRKDGEQLRSGCTAYSAAIVSLTKPFELSSVSGDMGWRCISQEDFKTVGKVEDWHIELLKLNMHLIRMNSNV